MHISRPVLECQYCQLLRKRARDNKSSLWNDWNHGLHSIMPLKLKKARSVVMDLSGVVVTRGYMTSSPEAKTFMREHLKQYLREEWGKRSVRQDLELIRKKQEIRSRERNAKKPPPVVEHTNPILEQYNSLINNIIWRLDNEDHDPDPGILASFHINFNDWANKKGILRTPVYEEVGTVLKQWKDLGIKLYITLGSAEFLKTVLSKTTQGDLLPLIDAHLNLMCYDGRRAVKNLAKLPEMLDQPASSIVYLTRLPVDARVAKKSKIPVVLVVREDFVPQADALMKVATSTSSISIDNPKSSSSVSSAPSSTLKPKRSSSRNSVSRTESAAEQVAEQMVKHQNVSMKSALERSSDVEAIAPAESIDEEIDLRVTSKISIGVVREFPTVRRLDDIIWV